MVLPAMSSMLFDRAVVEHVEDRLDVVVDAVRGVGDDEVVAAGDRVQHRRGRRRGQVEAAAGEAHQRLRPAGGIAEVLELDAGAVEVAELLRELVRGEAALAREVADGDVLGGGGGGEAGGERRAEGEVAEAEGHWRVLSRRDRGRLSAGRSPSGRAGSGARRAARWRRARGRRAGRSPRTSAGSGS